MMSGVDDAGISLSAVGLQVGVLSSYALLSLRCVRPCELLGYFLPLRYFLDDTRWDSVPSSAWVALLSSEASSYFQ